MERCYPFVGFEVKSKDVLNVENIMSRKYKMSFKTEIQTNKVKRGTDTS